MISRLFHKWFPIILYWFRWGGKFLVNLFGSKSKSHPYHEHLFLIKLLIFSSNLGQKFFDNFDSFISLIILLELSMFGEKRTWWRHKVVICDLLSIFWPLVVFLTPQSQLSLQGTFDVWTDIKVLSTKADHGRRGDVKCRILSAFLWC